jgi:hydrophobic/amphiphilic exporter-1 (mainly G- bacteria), HAE1 family
MPSFSLRHPYFIIVVCLFICVLGITSIVQMPVDMFPPINIPVVLVATFYNGMPPEHDPGLISMRIGLAVPSPT